MKIRPLPSLTSAPGIAKRATRSFAAFSVLALTAWSVSVPALAASHGGHAGHGKTSARAAGKAHAAARAGAAHLRAAASHAHVERGTVQRRVRYHLDPHARRGGVHRVAFEPARPALGQAFRLHETADGGVSVGSEVAYMVDQGTSEPLFDKNSRVVTPIASITKLMTAMVVIDSARPLDERITVTDDDRDYEKGTGSRLSVGSMLSREDMLHIALMASENRAAAALSRFYPGGRPAFLDAMNRKAKELGMTDTHFENPTGLTSRNVSSARDLVKMINAAYQYPLIRQFSTDRTYTVFTGKRTIVYNSTNALIHNPSWEIGLQKTGFINEAGECLVMQTLVHARPVIMVLLDSSGKYTRFADAQRLRAWLDMGGVQRVTRADTSGDGT